MSATLAYRYRGVGEHHGKVALPNPHREITGAGRCAVRLLDERDWFPFVFICPQADLIVEPVTSSELVRLTLLMENKPPWRITTPRPTSG